MLPTMVYSHITLQSPPSERASHRGTKKSLSEEKANILLIKCYFFIFQIENNNKPVYAVSSLPSVSTSLQQAIEQEIIQSSSSVLQPLKYKLHPQPQQHLNKLQTDHQM